MSFNEKVNELFNTVLESIADKYELDFDELRTFVGTMKPAEKPTDKPTDKPAGKSKPAKKSSASEENDNPPEPPSELTVEKVMTSNVAELKALCKARKLIMGGKKDELVSRLLGFIKGEKPPARGRGSKGSKTSKASKEEDEKDEKDKKADKPETYVSKVINSLKEKRVAIKIVKNEWGNMEDPQTKFVFDKSNKVVGLQKSTGDIAQLTDEDIENCKRMRLAYETPFNLDVNKLNTADEGTDSDIEVVESDADDESDTESDVEL
jgi:hypothetical protein